MPYNYFAVYKPYGMLSQFTDGGERQVLGKLKAFPPDVYPIGRLDADSEGLLLLTDDTRMNHRLLHPSFAHRRTYLVQVEGTADAAACSRLVEGVTISINGVQHRAEALEARTVLRPEWLEERNPPIRFRKTVPDSWLELVLTEGKNRQVRKMTAAVGLPTLRLVRTAIESLSLEGMLPGDVKTFDYSTLQHLLKLKTIRSAQR